jgi:hypothetical protein
VSLGVEQDDGAVRNGSDVEVDAHVSAIDPSEERHDCNQRTGCNEREADEDPVAANAHARLSLRWG